MILKAYSVNIVGLSTKIHHFHYEITDEFFRQYGSGLLSEGQFSVEIALNKHETFIEADFDIKGKAGLVCDRSLDHFEYPIEIHRKVVFKYGDEDREISDDVIMINRDTVSLELGQFIYEFIGLAIPMKKLHPRFVQEEQEDETTEGGIVYTSGSDKNDQEADPRWEKLKNLKNKS